MISSRRRLVAVATGVLIALLMVEGLSWIAYRLAFGEPFRFAAAANRRDQRMAEARSRHPKPGGERLSLVAHPFLGFVQNPRHDPAGTLAAHTVPVSDWGFLDDGAPLRPPSPRELVVGIFGGSVAFWLSVHGREALARELEKLPELRDRRIVFVRTALGAFKQPQQLMALSYLLALHGHFDVIVNLDGFNEVALPPSALVSKQVFPFFPRGWPELLGAAGDPEHSLLVGRILYLEQLAGQRAAAFSGPLARRSVFVSTLWRALDHRLEHELATARAELEAYRPRDLAQPRDYAATGPARRYTSREEMYRDLVAGWRDSSLQMHHLCRANGIVYLHFLQPNQYFDGGKPMSAAERRIALPPISIHREHVQAAFPLLQEAGRQLTAQGVAFYDLTRVFAGLAQPLYVDNCCHVNPEGNRILGRAVGSAIATRLQQREMVSQAVPPAGGTDPGVTPTSHE